MGRVAVLSLLILASCASVHPPLQESVAVPGTEVSIEMVLIPDGPFWIATYEVTWEQFDAFYERPEDEEVDGVTRPSVGKNYLGLSGLPPDFLEARRPVTNVRLHSALAYCEWLSRKTGLLFRLPTETEWDLACGSIPENRAWRRENSNDRTHEVGGKEPNPRGLHDMIGNVWEYCLESAAPPDFIPVLRGGAWNTPPSDIRKTAPAKWSEADPSRPFSVWWFRSDFSQGFRVVRVDGRSDDPYARKIEISNLKGRERTVKVGRSTELFNRVTGEVRNSGDRTIHELGIKVYSLRPDGKPHLVDVSAGPSRRATFNVCYPVLPTSAHPGPHTQPLKPGESRSFTVDVPMSFDPDDEVQADGFGAEVLSVR